VKLVSFQIKGCFGFRDSDRIDLQDATNLIYILGRNSSGKTSFLTALSYFSPHVIPNTYPNFANFDPTSQQPFLLAEYRLGENDFTVGTFIKAFLTELDGSNQALSMAASKEYERYKEELVKKLRSLYASLFEALTVQGSLWVMRGAGGDYLFSAEPTFKVAQERKNQLSALLSEPPPIW